MRGATLERAHSGRYWVARFLAPDGSRRAVGLGSCEKYTAAQARRRLAELNVQIGQAPPPKGRMTLGEWCTKYREGRPGAEGTAAALALTIAKLHAGIGVGVQLRRLDSTHAERFREYLEGCGLAPATVGLHIGTARAILAAAVKAGHIGANPFEDLGGGAVAPAPWVYVGLPEFERLIEACPDAPWRCLFALCRLAGLRLGIRGGEALGLSWGSVGWPSRTLAVWDQKRHKIRVVPIEPRLYEILRAAFESASDRSGAVCPVPSSGIHAKAHAIVAAAGLTPYGKPFHSLRKSLVSDWSGKHPPYAVALWCGHSAEVARKFYYQPTPDQIAAVTG